MSTLFSDQLFHYAFSETKNICDKHWRCLLYLNLTNRKFKALYDPRVYYAMCFVRLSSQLCWLFEAFDNEKELLYKTPMQRVSFGMHWKQDFAAAAAPSFPRLNTHNTNVELRAQSVTGKNRLGTFNFHQLWNVDSCLRFWWSMKTVLTDVSLT